MDRDKVFELFDRINVWKRGGERAPHKPLLILYAMGKCQRNEGRLIPYSEVDEKLHSLLIEFGPLRKSVHPEYPFWRLQNDGIWEVLDADKLKRRKNSSDVLKSDLIKNNIFGGFIEPIYKSLRKDGRLLSEIAQIILTRNFPESIHDDILRTVGLNIGYKLVSGPKRDPNFQSRVFMAYEYKCAICDYDVRLENQIIGLEAAHIKWHMAGGPDIESNGIALCVLHHNVFDRGAFTISNDLKVLVSQKVHGGEGLNDWLLRYHDKAIRLPQSPDHYPRENYLGWHMKQVFKGPPRHTNKSI